MHSANNADDREALPPEEAVLCGLAQHGTVSRGEASGQHFLGGAGRWERPEGRDSAQSLHRRLSTVSILLLSLANKC